MGLMGTLGLGLLGWYYAHTWTHPTQARKAAETTSRNQATGEIEASAPCGDVNDHEQGEHADDRPADAVEHLGDDERRIVVE